MPRSSDAWINSGQLRPNAKATGQTSADMPFASCQHSIARYLYHLHLLSSHLFSSPLLSSPLISSPHLYLLSSTLPLIPYLLSSPLLSSPSHIQLLSIKSPSPQYHLSSSLSPLLYISSHPPLLILSIHPSPPYFPLSVSSPCSYHLLSFYYDTILLMYGEHEYIVVHCTPM